MNDFFCNTFSIIARDPKTGAFGGASASFYPGLGAFTPFIKSGVAVIASQGFTNPLLPQDIADKLIEGKDPQTALLEVLSQDKAANLRQVSVIDKNGVAVAHTGQGNDPYFGHIIGQNYAIAGNILTSEKVLLDMESAFLSEKNFSKALMKALLAGDYAGGDKRGKKAAVIKVHGENSFPFIDFRIDDSDNATKELYDIFSRNYDTIMENYIPWTEKIKTEYK